MASTGGPLTWASRLADSEERLLDTRVTTSAHRLTRSELGKLLSDATAAFTAEEAATTELEASVERWHRSRARVLRRGLYVDMLGAHLDAASGGALRLARVAADDRLLAAVLAELDGAAAAARPLRVLDAHRIHASSGLPVGPVVAVLVPAASLEHALVGGGGLPADWQSGRGVDLAALGALVARSPPPPPHARIAAGPRWAERLCAAEWNLREADAAAWGLSAAAVDDDAQSDDEDGAVALPRAFLLLCRDGGDGAAPRPLFLLQYELNDALDAAPPPPAAAGDSDVPESLRQTREWATHARCARARDASTRALLARIERSRAALVDAHAPWRAEAALADRRREAELSRLVAEAKAELQRHRKAIHEVRRAQEDASLETPRTGRAMVMRAAGGALGSWRGRD